MPRMRNNMFGYLKRAALFFDMKARAIPPLVFIILLIIIPVENLIKADAEQAVNMYYDELVSAARSGNMGEIPIIPQLPADAVIALSFWSLAFLILNGFISSIYIVGVISDARGLGCGVTDCVFTVIRRFLPLLVASVLYYCAFAAGFFLLIIPGVIISIMFIFYQCALLCDGKGVISSLRFSAQLTKGRRLDIFLVNLFANLFLLVIKMFFLIFVSQSNNAVFSYVSLFLSIITQLIINKLIAILYLDAYALTVKNTTAADIVSAS